MDSPLARAWLPPASIPDGEIARQAFSAPLATSRKNRLLEHSEQAISTKKESQLPGSPGILQSIKTIYKRRYNNALLMALRYIACLIERRFTLFF